MPWNNITDYSTGELVTAAVWEDVVENMAFIEEVGYQEFTSSKNVTATAEGSADLIVTLPAIDYEAVPHELFFFSPRVTPVASGVVLRFVLEDSTTVIGHLGRVEINASGTSAVPVHLPYRFTPTAASHTYNIRAYTASGTAAVEAGAGGSGTLLPGFIRVKRVPT